MQMLTLDLEVDYSLIGIHCAEEDYRLAYFINKYLKFNLKKHEYSLDFKNSEAAYPLFEYKDEPHFTNYYLINNKFVHHTNNQIQPGLFDNQISTVSYLIPEKKKIDFFLKIEGCSDFEDIQNIILKLNAIKHIITSYSIDPYSLKSKDHLIF